MADSRITPNLPFGDINLIVLTDVHSWVNGHGTNEGIDNLDVTYGDVVSFFEQLKGVCYDSIDDCGDLWLVQNGDWIDGTGLATDGDPSALIPLLERIPFNVLNTGNHELYKDSVIQEMRKPGGFLQWWGPRHLSSNIYMTDIGIQKNIHSPSMGKELEPMSNRYHVLKGRRSTVLVFGFIYNLVNPSDLVVVETVEEAVKEDWFREALTDSTIGYDAILVMLHAGHDDPSVEILRNAIRRITQETNIDPDGNLPIQFVAGHTHYRRYAVADPQSTVVEAGRYMDTVGWVSFPNSNTIRNEKKRRRLDNGLGNYTSSNESMKPSTESSTTATQPTTSPITDLFHHVFLDANVATLRESLGLSPHGDNGDEQQDFQTPLGKEVSDFIQETRDSLGLTQQLGCAPRDYQLNVSITREDSLWRLHRDEVGPHVLSTVQMADDAPPTTAANRRALIMSQDSWRYGLFGGDHLTYDDIIVVSPFNEPIYRVAVLPCSTIQQMEKSMNANTTDNFFNTLPAWIMAISPAGVPASGSNTVKLADGGDVCELYTNWFCLSRVEDGLLKTIHGEDSDVGTDKMWNPVETNLTTTNIWLSFVVDEWPCPGSSGKKGGHNNLPSVGGSKWKGPNNPLDAKQFVDKDGSFTTTGIVAVSLAILWTAVLCFCLAGYCCKRRIANSRDYDGVFRDGGYRDDESVDDDNVSTEDVSEADDGDTPVRIV